MQASPMRLYFFTKFIKTFIRTIQDLVMSSLRILSEFVEPLASQRRTALTRFLSRSKLPLSVEELSWAWLGDSVFTLNVRAKLSMLGSGPLELRAQRFLSNEYMANRIATYPHLVDLLAPAQAASVHCLGQLFEILIWLDRDFLEVEMQIIDSAVTPVPSIAQPSINWHRLYTTRPTGPFDFVNNAMVTRAQLTQLSFITPLRSEALFSVSYDNGAYTLLSGTNTATWVLAQLQGRKRLR